MNQHRLEFERIWNEVNGERAPLTTENIYKLYCRLCPDGGIRIPVYYGWGNEEVPQ